MKRKVFKKIFSRMILTFLASNSNILTPVLASDVSYTKSEDTVVQSKKNMSTTVGLEWGPYEGRLVWNRAPERCKGREMRLPTSNELVTAFLNGVKFVTDFRGDDYLSSTPNGENDIYSVGMSSGKVFENGKTFYLDKPGDGAHVRCVRVLQSILVPP